MAKRDLVQGTVAEGMTLPDGYHVAWAPHKGKQALFCAAKEFEVLYGGAKGGGKSDALVALSMVQANLPAYRGLVLRSKYSEVDELILRSHKLFPQHPLKPRWNAEFKRWMFPNTENQTGAGGALVEFGYCERRDHVEQYQGREWGYIGYDELGNQGDENVWIDLLKEIRCPDPRVVRMARASANPGYAGHAWIKKRFVVPCGKQGDKIHQFVLDMEGVEKFTLTRRFVPARITDNPVYANDPQYLANLASLPEVRRKQLLEGDWDIGIGLALEELSEEVHFCKPFNPPSHWFCFGSFDWGYRHKWVAIEFWVNEDGTIFVRECVKGWRELPDVIGQKMIRYLNVDEMKYMSAGHDCWHKHRARGENTPTVAERLQLLQIPLNRANQDRIHGLNNVRDYTAWVSRGPDGQDWEPKVRFMDTPNNRWLFDQLSGMVVDEDDPEVVLKVDCDPETGEGGDDGYDAFRYGIASRPPTGRSMAQNPHVSAFDPRVLKREALRLRKPEPRPSSDDDYRLALLEEAGIYV